MVKLKYKWLFVMNVMYENLGKIPESSPFKINYHCQLIVFLPGFTSITYMYLCYPRPAPELCFILNQMYQLCYQYFPISLFL